MGMNFQSAQPYPAGRLNAGDSGFRVLQFGAASEFCNSQPIGDLQDLGWLLVSGVFGELPWFGWLQDFCELKTSLQGVKRGKVVEKVEKAKRQLLEGGWGSLGGAWQKLDEMPHELDLFMKACHVTVKPSCEPSYAQLSHILGGKAGIDTWVAEREDLILYQTQVVPLI